MILQVLTIIFIGISLQFIFNTMLMFDVNKRVYNHRPGECRRIKGPEHGSEDIVVIDNQQIAFISSGLAFFQDPDSIHYNGKMYLYDMNKRNYEAKELKVIGLEDEDNFHPHGLSHYILKDETIRLFVISHTKQFKHSIILMDYIDNELRVVKTVKNDKFVRPNNIVATGEDSFLVSNDGGAQTKFWNAVESLSGFYKGSIVYFDGNMSHYILENTVANGISLSRDSKTLFVSHINQETIGVFKWDQKKIKIEKISEVSTLTGCDNFYVDEKDQLWSGCHPVIKDAFAHFENGSDPNTFAPSQVLRINFSPDYQSADMVEVFADDGRFISASSIAIGYDNQKQLLIGSVSRELVHCDISVPLDF